MKNKYYITTAIDYVNDAPHIGHAYEKIAADVLARYYRAMGNDVLFQTGTDEHGLKVTRAAKEVGQIPAEFVDIQAKKFESAWQNLNISFDNFVRTTAPGHEKKVQEYLTKIKKAGKIYQGKYAGFYCVACEEYKSEDQMEAGYCPVHKKPCEKISEEVYFFKLSEYGRHIEQAIKSDQMKIEPEARKNEVLSFIGQGLKDVAVSRTHVKWGIPLPWDQSHTTYVWFDALLNYLTGPKTTDFWPAHLHLIGKDILRFHAVIWPAILMSLGLELPKKIFAHGYLSVNGQKMSKSLGNVVDPNVLVEKYSTDAVRYFLLAEIPFGEDGDFSESKLQARYESDLANELGNLVMRVLTLSNKLKVKSEKLKVTTKNSKIDSLIEKLKFSEALTEIWKDVKAMNAEIDQTKLWDLVKTDKEKAKKYLENYLERIKTVAENLTPFMPETADKIKKQLKIGKTEILFPKK